MHFLFPFLFHLTTLYNVVSFFFFLYKSSTRKLLISIVINDHRDGFHHHLKNIIIVIITIIVIIFIIDVAIIIINTICNIWGNSRGKNKVIGFLGPGIISSNFSKALLILLLNTNNCILSSWFFHFLLSY